MKLDRCPVCLSTNINYYLTAKDHLLSKEAFQIYTCSACNLRFTNPRPPNSELANYYKSDEYISHSDDGTSLINSLYKIARKLTVRSKRKIISGLPGHKKLLDVGCGTGHFLAYCKQYAWQITGIEPNELARNKARQNSGAVIHEDLSNVVDKDFDVISLWHVLEHLPDLNDTLQILKAKLAPNGILVVAVPNFESYESSLFKEYWAAYDVPRHLYHFSQDSMRCLTGNNGLKIVKTHPMWLDSFYISLLSNQYKNNSKKYIRSFITGLLSNIYAIKSNNYSSLIYLIKKSED